VIGIEMAGIHGDLMLDHGELTAPRPFPGRTLTSPAYARGAAADSQASRTFAIAAINPSALARNLRRSA